MYDGLHGPWYPATVKLSREVDALPAGGSILVVMTWDRARIYREGIVIRRGAEIEARTVVVSMGAKDIISRLTGALLPIIITADVRAYCPRPLLLRIEDMAARPLN
ncbi:hypothetical protein [Paracoccus denitrificans]|uniref:hypothetical protein n=1 Tax=Paracoccus denitrificans TaxID=266 RepID=UPI000FECE2EF|nr:hypothetical protein [Paracoccus denitrificans]QAR27128.1 hypothetical protein EO213_12895 [Paracoccus denitrificans]UPV96093.1 hypothetical protein M0K93_05760 [Paracoccus denitrificans]WQO34544.1 hypothetical protein U0005_05675 [Paracoccus denitrificans]